MSEVIFKWIVLTEAKELVSIFILLLVQLLRYFTEKELEEIKLNLDFSIQYWEALLETCNGYKPDQSPPLISLCEGPRESFPEEAFETLLKNQKKPRPAMGFLRRANQLRVYLPPLTSIWAWKEHSRSRVSLLLSPQGADAHGKGGFISRFCLH